MPRDTTFHLTLTALSPVHIGTGSQLARGYDFLYDQKQSVAYVIHDEAALLLAEQKLNRRRELIKRKAAEYEAKPRRQQTKEDKRNILNDARDEKRLREALFRSLTLEDLISEKHRLLSYKELQDGKEVDGLPLVRYQLRGDLGNSDFINEHIKDVHGSAYMPGSSLKGAFRTAVAWQRLGEDAPRLARPGDKPKQADNEIEERLFVVEDTGSRVNDVNRDVWRALRVSDSSAIATPMELVSINIQQPDRTGKPAFTVVNVEAIPAESRCTATLHLDSYLLGPQPQQQRGLDYRKKGAALEQVVAACKAHGAHLLAQEEAFFRTRADRPQLQRFYQHLRQLALGEQSFLMQIGWGTGWHSKTYDDRLQQDGAWFADAVKAYRMQLQRRRFDEGDVFPSTRKLALQGGYPAFPLGWVRVDVTEGQS